MANQESPLAIAYREIRRERAKRDSARVARIVQLMASNTGMNEDRAMAIEEEEYLRA